MMNDNTALDPIIAEAVRQVRVAIARRERAAQEGQPSFIVWMTGEDMRRAMRVALNLRAARAQAQWN